jgi:flagellar hook-associated protein 1 FlgK
MAGDLLGISVSGALASQRALATTGHNIANANTEGYSVQRVELGARKPQIAGNGAIGTGVNVITVRRMFDDFVNVEVQENTATSKALETNFNYTSQVDNLLADPNVGLAPSLQTFFSAVNGVADDPQSTSARQVLISEADTLSDRFAYLDDRLSTLRRGVNKDLKNIVVELNDLANGLARVNDTIVKAREIGGNSPNDLLDQRDHLVTQISNLVSVRTAEQEDGRMNLFVGNGQALVVGSNAAQLEVEGSRFDPDEVEIVFKGGSSESIVTQFLTGGKLGGILDFQNTILDSTQNELGRIAIGMAQTFNAQHRLGMDLNSRLGNDFFTDASALSPKVLPHFSNKGDTLLNVGITNIDNLTTSDYSLMYNAGQYKLVRLSDDKLVGSWTSIPIDVKEEGFHISLQGGGPIQDGDKFIIRPTRAGAENFKTVIDDVKRVAAANPLRTEAAITNLGTGEISQAEILDSDNPIFNRENNKLNPPFILKFIDETHFEVLDNQGKPFEFKTAAVPEPPSIGFDEEGKPVAQAQRKDPELPSVSSILEYNPKMGTDVFPTPGGDDFGFRLRLSGNPKAGDSFRVEFNTDGIGDNANAVKLAALQDVPVLANGTTDYAEAYAQLISRVGSKTNELDVNGKAQQLLLSQAVERRESISGVNLDEEAANLVKYQNLYQANAQVMSVANKLIETLINAFR